MVAGFSSVARSRLIAAWLTRRPPDEHWLVLRPNGGGHAAVGSPVLEQDLGGACACCAGEAVLRARLPGWLAQGSWSRLIIDLPAQGQPGRLVDALRRSPLPRSLDPISVVTVVGGEPGALRAFERLDDPAAPALIQGLARDQIEAAGRVWSADPAAPAALIARLAAWPPFGREIAHEAGSVAAWWAPPAGLLDEAGGGLIAWPGAPAMPDGRARSHHWRWPAGTRCSRTGFLDLLQALGLLDGTAPGCGLRVVFESEREAYRLHLPLPDPGPAPAAHPRRAVSRALTPTAYRGPGRLEVTDSGGLDPFWLARLDRALRHWLVPDPGPVAPGAAAVDPVE